MAFVAASNPSGKTAPTFGQLYRHGSKTQNQFQCGWNASYLKAPKAKPLSFAHFGHAQHMDLALKHRRAAQPSSQAPKQVPSVAPSQLAQQADQYFMAGRRGCGFVNRAIQQHALQQKTVVELDCTGDDREHPVCQIQAKHHRGTPMYYKQTGPESYELVHKGYTENLAFLP